MTSMLQDQVSSPSGPMTLACLVVRAKGIPSLPVQAQMEALGLNSPGLVTGLPYPQFRLHYHVLLPVRHLPSRRAAGLWLLGERPGNGQPQGRCLSLALPTTYLHTET